MAQAALTSETTERFEIKLPIKLGSQGFADHKYAYYAWLREHAPVHRTKISVIDVTLVSRYDDCVSVLKDPRFARDRRKATGGRQRFPVPLPKSIALFATSMIQEDDPEHRRLRNLVKKAFTPGALGRVEARIEGLTQQLLDDAAKQGHVDLKQAYSLPIPVTVISEMVGVRGEDMGRFKESMKILSEGMTGFRVLRTMLFDLPRAARFVRELVVRKRDDPQDDILTGLIQAEEEGDRLSEDEIVSMVFLLIVAGYETTVHLITNGVLALLQHPEQLERLRGSPELLDSAVDEILRYCGPVHGTKPNNATEDVEIGGVTIPKGSAVIPLLGSANRDAAVFDDPDVFDIGRTPNHHLAFGHGAHFCLGSQLARMETRIALRSLLERFPGLRLAVPAEAVRVQNMPFWHRHHSLPVVLG